ncbi:MAG: GerW family sporulation protein [Clostridia bacterium]
MAHPLETIMQSTLSELKQLVDVDTIIGKPVQLGDGRLVMPVSRVSLGFVSGGGEYSTKNPVMNAGLTLDSSNRPYPFAGMLTAGVSIMPVAFLSVSDEHVGVLSATEQEPYAKIMQLVPEMLHTVQELVASLSKDRRAK